jgi:hypothetical protein
MVVMEIASWVMQIKLINFLQLFLM